MKIAKYALILLALGFAGCGSDKNETENKGVITTPTLNPPGSGSGSGSSGGANYTVDYFKQDVYADQFLGSESNTNSEIYNRERRDATTFKQKGTYVVTYSSQSGMISNHAMFTGGISKDGLLQSLINIVNTATLLPMPLGSPINDQGRCGNRCYRFQTSNGNVYEIDLDVPLAGNPKNIYFQSTNQNHYLLYYQIN